MRTTFVNTPEGIKQVNLSQIADNPTQIQNIDGKKYYSSDDEIKVDVEIFIHNRNSLAKQLKNITGDSYNAPEYEELHGLHLIKHLPSGRIIRSYSKDELLKQFDEKEEHQEYINQVRARLFSNRNLFEHDLYAVIVKVGGSYELYGQYWTEQAILTGFSSDGRGKFICMLCTTKLAEHRITTLTNRLETEKYDMSSEQRSKLQQEITRYKNVIAWNGDYK